LTWVNGGRPVADTMKWHDAAGPADQEMIE